MDRQADQTEQFDDPERRHRAWIEVTLIVLTLISLGAIGQLDNWFGGVFQRAECISIWGMPGHTIVIYGIFVGLPIVWAAVVAGLLVPNGVRIIREGQFPVRGVKTLAPQRIVRGWRAKANGYVLALAWVPLAVIAAWGALQADKLTAGQPAATSCVGSGAGPAQE